MKNTHLFVLTLTLHNAFDILHDVDSVLPAGEALCEIPFGEGHSSDVITSVHEVLSLDKIEVTTTHELGTYVQELPSELWIQTG